MKTKQVEICEYQRVVCVSLLTDILDILDWNDGADTDIYKEIENIVGE